MNIPVKIPNPFEEADALDDAIEARAAEALARFRAQWPPERCKTLGDAVCGTPAQKAAANAKLVAQALARAKPATPADDAVGRLIADLAKGARQFKRSGL
jgi:hypothetical protein